MKKVNGRVLFVISVLFLVGCKQMNQDKKIEKKTDSSFQSPLDWNDTDHHSIVPSTGSFIRYRNDVYPFELTYSTVTWEFPLTFKDGYTRLGEAYPEGAGGENDHVETSSVIVGISPEVGVDDVDFDSFPWDTGQISTVSINGTLFLMAETTGYPPAMHLCAIEGPVSIYVSYETRHGTIRGPMPLRNEFLDLIKSVRFYEDTRTRSKK